MLCQASSARNTVNKHREFSSTLVSCSRLANLEPFLVKHAGLAWEGLEGHQGHVCQLCLLSFYAIKASQLTKLCFFFFFCFPVGGAESSAIGRSLNMQHASLFCHIRSAFADMTFLLQKSRQPWKRWPLETKEKKSRETSLCSPRSWYFQLACITWLAPPVLACLFGLVILPLLGYKRTALSAGWRRDREKSNCRENPS
jgi:hypothetical protein